MGTVQNGPLRDQAYTALKKAIVTLEIPPGSYIVDAEICERIGLGRTPVREALFRLAGEGLVELHPKKGFLAPEITLRRSRELFEVRIALERLLASLVCGQITPQRLKDLRDLVGAMEQAASNGDFFTMTMTDMEFHIQLAHASGNSYLSEILSNVYNHSLRLWVVSFRQAKDLTQLARNHGKLLDALEEGLVERVEKAFVEHVEDGARRVVGYLTANLYG